MKGILADVNVTGNVKILVKRMQSEAWIDFWNELGLVLRVFEDVGLTPRSSDREIWLKCQAEELVLVTDNRNADSPDSLELAIRDHNSPQSLPVFTISNAKALKTSRDYADKVVVSLYDYLLRIDSVRGTGRLFLP